MILDHHYASNVNSLLKGTGIRRLKTYPNQGERKNRRIRPLYLSISHYHTQERPYRSKSSSPPLKYTTSHQSCDTPGRTPPSPPSTAGACPRTCSSVRSAPHLARLALDVSFGGAWSRGDGGSSPGRRKARRSDVDGKVRNPFWGCFGW